MDRIRQSEGAHLRRWHINIKGSARTGSSAAHQNAFPGHAVLASLFAQFDLCNVSGKPPVSQKLLGINNKGKQENQALV